MAEEEKEKEKEVAPEVKSSSSSTQNPVVGLMLVINAVLLGVVAFYQFQSHKAKLSEPRIEDVVSAQMKKMSEEAEESELGEKEVKQEGRLVPMETFTANLAQGDGPRRYIRMDITLKFSGDSKEEEYTARKPQIRDAVISILNSKRPEDILKVEGKTYLKDEIKAAINSFLIDGQIVDIYYTSLQIN